MTNIIVKFSFEGMHNWPGVVNHPDLKEVDFLQYVHRHNFTVVMKKRVSHDDRDIEIIQLKRKALDYVATKWGYCPAELGPQSCEMVAEHLAKEFGLNYCAVLEDGENGAEYVAE